MRTKTGIVTSTKMQKTIVVTVETYTHPKYKKRYKSSAKFYAHDENGLAKLGDTVTVSETRPLSALKRWMLVEDSIVSSQA